MIALFLPIKIQKLSMDQMPLDHFNSSNQATFENRYWLNIDGYEKNGPIIRKYIN
jgi:hypothetical protein